MPEPLIGLDAASASGIMGFIEEITRAEGLIIVYTIHQPSTSIYNSFDRIMLLSEGRMAYCGTRENVLPYFAAVKHPVPEHTNPAEFMLDLVNKDFSDEQRVRQVLHLWANCEAGEAVHAAYMGAQVKPGEPGPPTPTEMGTLAWKLSRQITRSNPDGSLNPEMSERFSDGASLPSQVGTMFRRHALLCLRDPTLFSGRTVMFVLSTVFFAVIYINARTRNQNQALQRMWYLIWIVGVPSNMGVIATYAYNVEFQAIKREARNGMVNPLAYLAANFVLQLPMMLLLAMCAISVGAYGMIAFNGAHYGEILVIYACVAFAFESIAQVLAVAFDNPLLGMLNYMQLWFASFLFCGIFVKVKDIIWPFRILSYILPLRYGFRSMVYEEFIDSTFTGALLCDPKANTAGDADVDAANCMYHSGETGSNDGWVCDNQGGACYGREGWQVLESIGNEFDVASAQDRTWSDVSILLGVAMGMKIIYMVIMVVKSRQASTIQPRSMEKFGKDGNRNGSGVGCVGDSSDCELIGGNIDIAGTDDNMSSRDRDGGPTSTRS